ncbi:MAG: ABC transporter substrate-binding protein [Blastocatellia bacterium]|nr:ABC transporter substrate-binding protein [Blastocatellia bacterium]
MDTLTSTASDAAADRVRNLMFNSLVKKNERLEYVGDLAREINTSEDGLTLTFNLHQNVKFHNGAEFTSADVKYTMDELFNSNGYKSKAFADTIDGQAVPHITSLETPDTYTVVIGVRSPALANQLLSNLVAIPIIARGSVAQQAEQPLGTGPFKFVNFDRAQNTVDMESFAEYWEGAPGITRLRVKTVPDASSLQAELQTGGVDIAPNPTNLPPDALVALRQLGSLKVEQFQGTNIQYIGLNTTSAPLDKKQVRQAIGYGIDKEKIIKELLSDQAQIAHSILPASSWAHSAGTEYRYDPERAKQLLSEAGYKYEPIKFKFSAGNAAVSQYAQAIQSSLIGVGLNIEIETLDANTLREHLAQGQFQLNTGQWIGGNQDPIFLKDLFTTGRIPGKAASCCNRSRYSNQQVDQLVEQAINETDRERAKDLYTSAWAIISDDLPLLPLWYPANMVISTNRVQNVKINPSGDWSFVKDITISN